MQRLSPQVGSNWESGSSGASSLPFPHMPQENGKFSQDSQHLPAALGRLREPAGGRAGRRGREAALTWHTKAPHTSRGRRHSQVRGPRRARPREIPAAPEPRTHPPQAAFSPPPAAPGAPSWLWLGARGPGAGEGGSCSRPRPGRRSPLPGREGRSPGARRGFTHGARRSRPRPRPARCRLRRPPGMALCK